jgi:hypothetical protein
MIRRRFLPQLITDVDLSVFYAPTHGIEYLTHIADPILACVVLIEVQRAREDEKPSRPDQVHKIGYVRMAVREKNVSPFGAQVDGKVFAQVSAPRPHGAICPIVQCGG